MNVLDLFSGIGGFSLGLERAGMRTVAFCEIDPYCRRVLAKYWPTVPVFGDVRELTAERLVADANYQRQLQQGGSFSQERRWVGDCGIDVICGGFPCQDISTAGKGAGIGGARSGLWSEYARIIGEVRPQYAIVENVAALLGRGLERVLGDLAALGYDAEWHCIPASAVGAPHRRDRVWIVAYSQIGGARAGDKSSAGICGSGLPTTKRQEREDAQQWDFRHDADNGGSCNADVADADQPRLALGGMLAGILCGTGNGDARQVVSVGDWWRIEPCVGRVAHGIPAELDGGANGKEKHDTQASTQGNGPDSGVSSVWRHGQAGAASPRLFPTGLDPSALSGMPYQGGSERRHAPQQDDASLRTLRQGVHADTQQETQSVRPGMPRNRWPHERGETLAEIWATEPDIGRVAHGVENRVDRLRSLGNAVVPQIPEIIGRAIMSLT